MARDPLRRRASRDLQNSRRKLERAAARLRKQANEIEKARRNQWRKTHPDEHRKFDPSPITKRLRNQARNYERMAKRATTKGKSIEQIYEKIADMDVRVEESKGYVTSNAQFRFELGMAQRGETTNIFGKGGEASQTKARLFWMMTKQAWQGANTPEQRYDAILAHYGATSLKDVYDQISATDYFTDFVAKWLSIDYSNVDTTSEAWQELINERFEDLGSPEQQQIVQAYNNMYGVLM